MPDTNRALERFQEYYAVPDAISIQLDPLPLDTVLPDWESFEREIPEVFRLANQIKNTEHAFQALVRHTQHSNKAQDITSLIIHVLEQQNLKLDALLSYILKKENQSSHSWQTCTYGGGGVQYKTAQNSLVVGQLVLLKVFIAESAIAIYSYAEVAQIEPLAKDTQTEQNKEEFLVTLAFSRILEEDQETLIKTSLQAQTKLLKQRKKDSRTQPTAD